MTQKEDTNECHRYLAGDADRERWRTQPKGVAYCGTDEGDQRRRQAGLTGGGDGRRRRAEEGTQRRHAEKSQ